MENRKYIRNLTLSLMGQVGINLKTIKSHNTDPTDWYMLARDLWEQYALEISVVLRRMKPETLGKIAAYGEATSLYEVHGDQHWLDLLTPGRDLLLKIACTTVIAEMADILKLWISQSECAA